MSSIKWARTYFRQSIRRCTTSCWSRPTSLSWSWSLMQCLWETHGNASRPNSNLDVYTHLPRTVSREPFSLARPSLCLLVLDASWSYCNDGLIKRKFVPNVIRMFCLVEVILHFLVADKRGFLVGFFSKNVFSCFSRWNLYKANHMTSGKTGE